MQQIHSLDIQSLEYEKVTNSTQKNIELTLPSPFEVRNASESAILLSDRKFLLTPGSSIEWVKPKVPSLLLFSPIEGFSTTVKISLWSGLLLSCPVWVYLIARFLTPGLKNNEKYYLIPVITTIFTFILIGFFVAIWVTLPVTNHYFSSFNQALGVNAWGLSYYVDYVLTLMVGHGIAFASASLLFFAMHFGLISHRSLAAYRRHAIIVILILSAFLTPPDVISQIMLAIPLMCLFEAVIMYGKIRDRVAKRFSYPV